MDDFVPKVEYGECRSAIANFDKILTDLRLKGISLILAFDGVSAFANKYYVPLGNSGFKLSVLVIMQLIVIALIVSVFWLDRVYTYMLLSVVDRAKAVEEKYSQTLPLRRPGQRPRNTHPLTIGISETFKTKFKTIARGHWIVYGFLFFISVSLIVVYCFAKSGGS